MNIRAFVWLAALAFCGKAVAADSQFSMEQPLTAPVPVTALATASVRMRLTDPYGRFGCVGSLADNLKAALLDLGPDLKSILIVKPKGMCLCGVNSCHFWLLQRASARHRMRLIGEIHAHSLTVVARKRNSLASELRSWSGTANGTTEQSFRYIGGRYVAYRTEHS